MKICKWFSLILLRLWLCGMKTWPSPRNSLTYMGSSSLSVCCRVICFFLIYAFASMPRSSNVLLTYCLVLRMLTQYSRNWWRRPYYVASSLLFSHISSYLCSTCYLGNRVKTALCYITIFCYVILFSSWLIKYTFVPQWRSERRRAARTMTAWDFPPRRCLRCSFGHPVTYVATSHQPQ